MSNRVFCIGKVTLRNLVPIAGLVLFGGCLPGVTEKSDEPDGSIRMPDAGSEGDAGFETGLGSDAGTTETGTADAGPSPLSGPDAGTAGCRGCPCEADSSCDNGMVCIEQPEPANICLGVNWAPPSEAVDDSLIWDEGQWR